MNVPKEVPPVCAIVGSDRFLRGMALEETLRALGSSADDFGPIRLDGGNAAPADVLDEARTPSLLGGRRVVIVDDADDCITEGRKAFENYAGAPSQDACLILLCDSLPSNTRLYKKIQERGGVGTVEAPKGKALNTWIVQRAKHDYKKRIADATAQMIRDHLGDGLAGIDSELGKLATYIGSRDEITREDVEALTGQSREEKVFRIVDAMSAGQTDVALKMWEQVLATNRAAPALAIGGLAWSLRTLVEARSDFDAGRDLFAHTRKMFTDPATLRRRLEQNPISRLRAMQSDLLTLDLAVKTSGATVELGIEKFIVTHSVSGGASRAKAG